MSVCLSVFFYFTLLVLPSWWINVYITMAQQLMPLFNWATITSIIWDTVQIIHLTIVTNFKDNSVRHDKLCGRWIKIHRYSFFCSCLHRKDVLPIWWNIKRILQVDFSRLTIESLHTDFRCTSSMIHLQVLCSDCLYQSFAQSLWTLTNQL